MKSRLSQGLFVVGACLLMSPLLLYSKLQWQRPSRTNLAVPLFAGITYQREVYETPWPYIVHIVSIDLTASGLKVKVSSDDAIAEGSRDDNFETTAHTTSDFLVANSLQLAVNASYFYPFQEKTPWNFYPHPGDRVNVVGEAIANGERYSDPKAHWPALCFGAGNQAQIASDGTCPDGTLEAIAGSEVLLHHGKPIPLAAKPDFPYARVAAAIDASGEHLWLIVVDGKQPHYSQGATLTQLSQIARKLGADAAINLDGGGSTTLVMATPKGPKVLNAPIHTRLPLRERPVANQLGFQAEK